MNELKEIYDIELTHSEIVKKAIEILTEDYQRVNKVLEMASYRPQRIEALTREEAIIYLFRLIGGEYE